MMVGLSVLMALALSLVSEHCHIGAARGCTYVVDTEAVVDEVDTVAMVDEVDTVAVVKELDTVAVVEEVDTVAVVE